MEDCKDAPYSEEYYDLLVSYLRLENEYLPEDCIQNIENLGSEHSKRRYTRGIPLWNGIYKRTDRYGIVNRCTSSGSTSPG